MIVTLHIDLSKNCCVGPTERMGGRETQMFWEEMGKQCIREINPYTPQQVVNRLFFKPQNLETGI